LGLARLATPQVILPLPTAPSAASGCGPGPRNRASLAAALRRRARRCSRPGTPRTRTRRSR